MLYYFLYTKEEREVFIVQPVGTITVSVFTDEDNNKEFRIETDNDDILPVSYVIEDTLKKY